MLRQNGLMLVVVLVCLPVLAARIPDVANTKHNLSVNGPGPVKAVVEDQVCVFCHTPHGATNFPGAPLWNREIATNQTYTVYTSSSLDADDIMGQLDQPGGSSKLCLSCHDGTLAIGTVNVLGGQQNVTINMTGTAPDGTMPPGAGELTGFTRDLGIDLSNDHPISLNYDTNLANVDTELTDPVAAAHIGVRAPGFRPPVPLEDTGQGGAPQIQCASCHDPHLREETNDFAKFLRLNRFQLSSPLGGAFNEAIDIVCLACHEKTGWDTSAHATLDATEAYTLQASTEREFPDNLPVWQASCLNCHDTHSVHGSRRLLREGTDSTATPKSGGNAALEETCYQCHSLTPIVTNPQGDVKDIESEFGLAVRMPIDSADQPAGTEVHDIVDSNFIEPREQLGALNQLANRHVECTDCHNPHRVMRNALFSGTGAADATHNHASGHTNIASGALRGSWGVEPLSYTGTQFTSLPSSFLVKEGDGGLGASTDVNSTWVTREYQICLKCHSNYAYEDNGAFPTGTRPNLQSFIGGTPSNTNGLTQYTNQAMEFQAPLGHAGENGGVTGSGAGSNFEGVNTFDVGNNGNVHFNHRSWHPVMEPTGRTLGARGNMASNAFLVPFRGAANVGTQTMYCSDCHGNTTDPTTVVPTDPAPWGPHGSGNNFILKGTWDDQTGGATDRDPAPDADNGLCFKCHDFTTYSTRDGDGGNTSGFAGSASNNLHGVHADRIGSMHCMWCHAAVPHGWKNKALLVNLNDLGPEAGEAGNVEFIMGASADVFNREPYYFNAKLKVVTFAQSGNWEETNCGSAGLNQGGNDTTTGRDWMGAVCANPP